MADRSGLTAPAQRTQGILGEGTLAAPDLLVFEVLAVLRRDVQRETIAHDRARAAIEDLGDLALDLFSTLPFRDHAWEL